ncbi:MAG: glycosyltransferase [Rhodoferax sp.]|nr:glycosyltransferase [Rhodoferax sp.]MDP3651347.1 glycosyltransferase [Rhodoferax sp.]
MMHTVTPGLVSIIVASYNHAEYLDRRMESLISQTYKNIEIIVIDDCSPDNSLQILRKYETNPKIKLIIRQENGGWVAVSNQGLEMSSGEFVIFANCDDECDHQLIEKLIGGMHKYPTAGISYCRSLLIDENNRILGNDFSIREKAFRLKCVNDTLLTQKEMGRFLLHSCVIPNLSAALFRKAAFSNVGGLTSSYRVCSDWDLFFRIVSCYDVAYIAAPLNKFRQHCTTIRSSTKDRVIYEEYIRLLLGKIKVLNLSLIEKARYRTRVMYLWAIHILSPSLNVGINFNYHVKNVIQIDPVAMAFLPIAILVRVAVLLRKLPSRLFSKIFI